MSEIPSCWTIATLNEVGVITTGTTPSTKEPNFYDGTTPFVKPSDLDQANAIILTKQTLTNQGIQQARLLRAGAVLVSCIGNLGKVGIAGVPLVTNQQINAIEFDSSLVNDRYGFFYCKTLQSWMEQEASATTISILNKSRFASAPFILAPLNEQKRIADKLDQLLAAVDSCKTRLDTIPGIIKRFRQSVLAAATSGELTKDFRVDASEDIQMEAVEEPYFHKIIAPSTWKQTTLGDVCEFVGGSQPPKSTFQSEAATGLIRLIQIRDYKSDRYLTYIPISLARRFCTKDDVMIGRYGPPIFQILRGLDGAYNVALMKAVPRTEALNREYLYYFLQGEQLLRFVESGSDRTAGQDGVRKELVNRYPFFLPSGNEQQEIVRRVEALFAVVDRLEARYQTAYAQVDHLTSSLLGKAFRGELVPQNPNDEPAEKLLERIRTAKDSTPVKRQTRRKNGK